MKTVLLGNLIMGPREVWGLGMENTKQISLVLG